MMSQTGERLVLQKLLNNDEFLRQIRGLVKPEHFEDTASRKVYAALMTATGGGNWEASIESVTNQIGQDAADNGGDGTQAIALYAEMMIGEDPGDVSGHLEQMVKRIPMGAIARVDLTFDRGLIGGCAGEYADLYSAKLESPWQFFAFSFLTVLGEILADRIRLDSELKTQPRLYTVLIGESAWTRKSEAIQQTVEFFRDGELLDDVGVCFGVGSAEGLAMQMAKTDGQRKTIMVLDELQTFVSKARIESSVLLQVVNSLFEKNFYSSRTKATDIKIEDGCLAILAASTAETYSGMFTDQFIRIGFINRLWVVAGEPDKFYPIPERIENMARMALLDNVKHALRHIESGYVLGFSKEAVEEYTKWYMDNRNESNRSEVSRRLDTYALRLMMIMAVNEGLGEIDKELVQRIIALVEWEKKVRVIHDPIDAESIVGKIEGLIRKELQRNGAMRERALKRAIHYNRYGLYFYAQAMHNLIEAAEVNKDERTGEIGLTLGSL